MTTSPTRTAALALYTPPFRYEHGYIFDANGHMVADDCGEQPGVATRVRGWGRIGYMKDAEALQDEVGTLIAEILTAHWGSAGCSVSNRQTSGAITPAEVSQVMKLVGQYGSAVEANSTGNPSNHSLALEESRAFEAVRERLKAIGSDPC